MFRFGKSEGMIRLALSPDSTHILTGHGANLARYWDLASGEEIHRLDHPEGQVYATAVSPDGKWLASAGENSVIYLWDAVSGKQTKQLKGHVSTVTGLGFSPDSKHIVSAGWDKTLRLWDLSPGEEVLNTPAHADAIQGACFSPNGKLVASWSFDKTARIWDAKTLKEVQCLEGHAAMLRAAVFSTDSERLLTGDHPKPGAGPGTLKLWDVRTGNVLVSIDGIAGGIHGVAMSKDSRRALTSSGAGAGLVQLWDLETGKQIIAFKGHDPAHGATDVAFLPGNHAVSVGGDGTVRVWQLPRLAEPGWVQLFNGKDLTGWKTHPDKPGKWRVENNLLVGDGPPSHLFSQRGDYENFHLRAVAKINKGGNSGILFRSKFGHDFGLQHGKTVIKMPAGFEVELASTSQFPTGSIIRLGPAFASYKAETTPTPHDTWITLEIIARGKRVITKVDGQQATDVELPDPVQQKGHVALQVHITPDTVVQFKSIEIKELTPQSAPVPRTADEVMHALAGVWKQEITQKVFDGKPVNRKFNEHAVIDWIAGKKFLKQRKQDKGWPNDLIVYGFDPAKNEFRSWYFDAKGDMRGPGSGRWDPATKTLTLTDLPRDDMHSIKTIRFEEGGAVTWELVHRHKDGKVLWEFAGKMTRSNAPAEIDEDFIAGVPHPEMKVLDRLVGDWQTQGTIKTPDKPAGVKFTTSVASRKILGGRLIASQETGLPGHPDAYWLTGYDRNMKAFRFWMFNADGNVMELGGGWDDKSQTMKWNWAGRDGSTSAATWHWTSPDRRVWTTVMKDASGKTSLDIDATSVRQNEPGWVQLFNGKNLAGWKTHPSKADGWTIEGNELVGRGPGSYLFSERGDYENFHLRVEAHANAAANAGQVFRTPFGAADKDGYVGGYEADIGDFGGALIYFDKQGKRVSPPVTERFVKDNEWFTQEVIARGNHIIILVNGKKVVDHVDMTDTHRRGHLALQAWRPKTVVRFRKIEIKELPPTDVAPFVLLARDKRAESRHATLADAVKAAQPGDTIEIHGNGPFDTEPIRTDNKALTIRAGAGFRPHLRHQPVNAEAKGALLSTGGPLVLEGLTLERGANPETKTFAAGTSVVSVHKAPLRLANCRFVGRQLQAVVSQHLVADGVIANCEVLGQNQSGIHFNTPPSGRLVLDNNLVVAANGVGRAITDGDRLDKLENVAVSLRRHTILAGHPLSFHTNIPLDPAKLADPKRRRMRLDASGNIFSGEVACGFPAIDKSLELKDAAPLLPKLLSFQDDDNLYDVDSDAFLEVYRQEGVPFKTITSLAEWHKFWDVTRSSSQVGKPVFVGGDVNAKTRADPAAVTAADFRLAPGSPGKGAGPGGTDLGADVDLVGPGPAYEKWKKTKEYEAWRKECDKLMASAPPPAIAPFNAAKAKEHQDAWAKYLGMDVEITNSIGMKLRLIPPGTFLMGSTKKEVDALIAKAPPELKDVYLSETPRREMTIDEPYYMGSHEVTVGQFRQFVKETGYKTSAERDGKGGVIFDFAEKKMKRSPENIWSNPRFAVSDEHPVVLVTQADAEAFCAWLSKKEGRRYVLPREDQWEFACRGGTTTSWWPGNDVKELRTHEFMKFDADGFQPIGLMKTNPFGLFDLHGNVAEWCLAMDGKLLGRGDRGQIGLSRSAARHEATPNMTSNNHGFRVAVVGDFRKP
jgi:formylglycine-generating enzyme required for sulfatase activity